MAEARSNKKNGLIELFRFLCSVWVVYYHGFFPILSEEFRGAVISVDFFFMVSGLFFLKSMESYKDKSFLEGLRFILWGRTKKILLPLLISAFSILLCNLMFELDFGGFNWPLSFLWFFAAQFLFLALFYLFYKNIKRRVRFNIVCVVIILVFMSTFRLTGREFDRMFRGSAMVAIGILLSQIPRIRLNLKNKITEEKTTLFVNALGFVICASAFVFLAYLPKFEIWKLHLQCCVVCPLMLYFAKNLPVRSRLLNLLGELSVFIYLGQCPILIHHYLVSENTKDQFVPLCICVVAMFVLNRIFNLLRTKFKKAA